MGQQDASSKTYSGLYAPSPSEYIGYSHVVQIPGSLGFSESNGDLSIRLRILPNSPGTYRAVLHCAEAESRVYIVLSRLSNDLEYVRVRDAANISRGVIPESMDFLERQQIRVPVTPTKAPIPIFFGFWLRTLQPLGYNQCEITVLSKCKSPEEGFICQQHGDQGNTGIVRIEPKTTSDVSKTSGIRWVEFGFDETHNPMLWLAGVKHSAQIKETFENGMNNCHLRAASQVNYEDREEDQLRGIPAVLVRSHRDHHWPQTPICLKIDRNNGLNGLRIKGLGLKISVQMQHYPIPFVWTRLPSNNSDVPSKRVWGRVVDITEDPLPITPTYVEFLLYGCLCVA
jgi:hypothetical protein